MELKATNPDRGLVPADQGGPETEVSFDVKHTKPMQRANTASGRYLLYTLSRGPKMATLYLYHGPVEVEARNFKICLSS